MNVQTLSHFDEFEALHGEWNGLLRSAACRNAYLRHEWLSAWWKGFGAGARLELCLLRDGQALAGVLPLMRSRRTLSGLPVTALHFLGSNVAHLEACVRPGVLGEGLRLLFDSALRRPGIDVVLLRGLPAKGDQESTARLVAGEGRAVLRWSACDELILPAGEGLAAYRQGRSRKFWSNVRNRSRRLAEAGSVAYDRRCTAAEISGALEETFELSVRSWKGRTGTAVGLQSRHRAYLAELLNRFGSQGEAELWLLRLDGRAIAYRIGFRDGVRFVECDIAYDDEYRPFSPGTLLAVESNETLIRQGIEEINLGIAFPWKEEWSPVRRARLEAQLLPGRRPYTLLLRLARSIRDRRDRGRAAGDED